MLQMLANNYFTLYITTHYITYETIYIHYYQMLQIYKLTKCTPL
jgi:hypothetical protein